MFVKWSIRLSQEVKDLLRLLTYLNLKINFKHVLQDFFAIKLYDLPITNICDDVRKNMSYKTFSIKLYVLPITNICDDVRKYAFKYQHVILYAFVILYLKYELMLYM